MAGVRMAGATAGTAPISGNLERGIGSRRGVAFAIAAMLLGATILSLAAMLSAQAAYTRQTAVRMLEVDGAADGFYNSQRQIASIIRGTTQITVMPDPNVSTNITTLTINESLPPSQYLNSDLDAYANASRNLSEYSLSYDFSGFGNGTYSIMPGEGSIEHPPSQFRLLPSTGQVEHLQAYDMQVTFGATPGFAQWESGGSGAGIPVSFRAFNPTHTSSFQVNGNVSGTGYAKINVTDTSGMLIGHVEFDHGKMALWYDEAQNGYITLKTSANFTQPVYVEANATMTLVGEQWNRTALVQVS